MNNSIQEKLNKAYELERQRKALLSDTEVQKHLKEHRQEIVNREYHYPRHISVCLVTLLQNKQKMQAVLSLLDDNDKKVLTEVQNKYKMNVTRDSFATAMKTVFLK